LRIDEDLVKVEMIVYVNNFENYNFIINSYDLLQ